MDCFDLTILINLNYEPIIRRNSDLTEKHLEK